MAMTKAKKTEKFDFLIMGDNWTGWLLGLALSRQKHNTAIVGSKSHWNHSTIPQDQFGWPQEIELYSPLSKDHLQWLSQLVDEEVFRDPEIHIEQTIWEKGQWIPFAGFGEAPFASVEYLSQFYISSAVNMIHPIQTWKQRVVDQFTGTHFPSTELTGFEYEGDHITSVTINGNDKLQAHTYLYCDSPRPLLELFPGDLIARQWRQRISKSKTMTRLLWMLKHDKVRDEPNTLYFLPGHKNHEPFVGQILTRSPISLWQSLLSDEEAEDPEVIGSQLRYMKRQLKRPFSEWFTNLVEEKVIVESESYGYMELNPQMTQLKNFWQSSLLTQKSHGVLGHLAAAQFLHQQLQSSL